jgi:hypothetical protein
MRRSRGSDPYETWTAGRAQLRDPRLPVAAHAYDLDQMKSAFIERWRLIALRRSPAQSRPPSNYELVWSGRFYEVWKRVRPAPLAHVELGKPPLDPTEPLDCSLVRELDATGRVVAALRVRPRVAAIRGVGSLPPGWYRDPRDAYALDVRKGGSTTTALMGGGNVRLWLRGRAFRADRVLVDGRLVGVARHLNGPNQWIDVGAVRLAPGRHVIELRRPKRSLRPGDAQTDVIGPFAATAGEPVLVSGAELRRHCGQPADWIDVLPQ